MFQLHSSQSTQSSEALNAAECIASRRRGRRGRRWEAQPNILTDDEIYYKAAAREKEGGRAQPNILTDDEMYYKVIGPDRHSQYIKGKGQLLRLKANGEMRAAPFSSSSIDNPTVVELERRLAESEEE
ncbi:hypothetical protein TorRG33x02_262780 [Trema orientale]|uniref:Uncharacterized protein n=1 Tax=Trema orientale TaxID=63057 RepID=A0A2P5D4A6_TREOI|nr:hypothetical protein TorRG33x02_262780 [Trema orientale]